MSSTYRGLSLSPGLAMGKICLIDSSHLAHRQTITEKEIQSELDLFHQALVSTRRELQELKEQVRHDVGESEAEIFEVQMMLTKDPYFIHQVEDKIEKDKKSAGWAIEETLEAALKSLENLEDPYFRDRINDFRDVSNRILETITASERQCYVGGEEDIIIAAETLLPSHTVNLRTVRIRGFITVHGGATSHAAILARSLGVPLVSGVPEFFHDAKVTDHVILIGFRGEVILNPTAEDVEHFQRVKEIQEIRRQKSEKLASLPSVTRDDISVTLLANIGSPDDIAPALKAGAEGVGLYRTELHFMDREEIASEEEQYNDYINVVKQATPRPVTIRTLDVGGDKVVGGMKFHKDPNPYLGYRAIRISLREPELFKIQIRAILRAAVHGPVKMMFPMISQLEELLSIRDIVKQVKADLTHEDVPFNPNVPLGIMVEVPSTAFMIDSFLPYVDFVSVGTNDLIQYLLAVDRGNETIASLYQPFNPSVLGMLKRIADRTSKYNIQASICGEIAGDPLFTESLVGMGYRILSMSAPFVIHVKMRIRSLDGPTSLQHAEKLLQFNLSKDIREYLQRRARKSLST